MHAYSKYAKVKRVRIEQRTWPENTITHSPVFVPVDLRDGNQAFANPMTAEKKLEYFDMLCRIGFREIEVAYPSASDEEFRFVRMLIEGKHIPDGVSISVLTAARGDLIQRTLESLEGAENAIVHCYVAASELHRKFVLGKTEGELISMAVSATEQIARSLKKRNFRYEFSPEEFSDGDPDFILELCSAVRRAWGPVRRMGEFIVNLPMTVERMGPNEFADRVEYFIKRYPYASDTVISVHVHNDQGMAVAASEMALLAGADRVEGTLFGHGERTGNMDLMVFAMNLHARGIECGLDFSRLEEIAKFVEGVSGISIHPRHPYAGKFVFTAFSGTHQDAIRKGMVRRTEISDYFHCGWKMPYLLIDPRDVGRDYSALVRINSQSGRGGVAFVLEHNFGILVPENLKSVLSEAVKKFSIRTGREVSASEVRELYFEISKTHKREFAVQL